MASLELLNKGTNQKDVCKPDLCCPCNIPYFAPRGKVPKPPRIVPPFSLQAHRQKNVMVEPFIQKSMIKPYPVGNTFFKKYYLRGDFPIALEYDNKGYKIGWKVKFKDLDYRYYLPMFFNGLCETEFPYQYFALQGILDMLAHGKRKILPVLPRIVTPLKNALNTRNRIVIAAALKCIQALVKSSDAIGEALVPYYRRLLPPLNIYRNLNVNIGDEIDYGQQKKENIGELVQETLELLEVFGGKHAFINIKYFIPTYESCIKNF